MENMDDAAEFREVVDALAVIGVSAEIWPGGGRPVAVMTLGNVEFGGDVEDEDAEASIAEGSQATMAHVAKMLGSRNWPVD